MRSTGSGTTTPPVGCGSPGGPPLLDETGVQLAADNVFVLYVDYRTSDADLESPQAISTGSGDGWLLRDGTITGVTWSRPFTVDRWVLADDDTGKLVALRPGRTWVALARLGEGGPPGAGSNYRTRRLICPGIGLRRTLPGSPFVDFAGMSDVTRSTGTQLVKRGLAEMLKGGVIMDVVDPAQAKIAEDAGAVAVMALERVPSEYVGTAVWLACPIRK
ncbi:MAG: hypothetical protein Ct9H300mP12_11880 [Acidimicrobiales bacterium]|nr:MAG: hypothetical protein Ct9H300mP12_11880 [Acidimicrobiales bacterium]